MDAEEKQRRLSFKQMLVAVARMFNDAPDFTDPEKLKTWCLYLYPNAEKVVPLLPQLPKMFNRWPSVADLLKAAGCGTLTNVEISRNAAASVWVYLENNGDLTPLGGRVFDTLGGWEKLGKIHFDYTTRRTYDLIFYNKAMELISESQDNSLPKLPEPKPCQKTLTDIQRMEAICDAKCTETHKDNYGQEGQCLYVKEDYETRRQTAIDAGLTYWEPPRCWEVSEERVKHPTKEDRRLWSEKIRRKLKETPAMQGSARNENRGDSCFS